ncbi:hypothetical protein K1719_004224 [Acacia pycnantha]|nr:hypothetical protein K1719_004224 [Acacia pycnantha]
MRPKKAKKNTNLHPKDTLTSSWCRTTEKLSEPNEVRSSFEGSQPEKKGDLGNSKDQKTSIQKMQSYEVTKEETEADAWEKAELEKIKQRYEELKETIDSWENKKRKEAKRMLNLQESQLEKRRLKAMDKFRDDLNRIDQITREAREKADAKRRKEELKAREKANRIRTGRLRGPCSCF